MNTAPPMHAISRPKPISPLYRRELTPADCSVIVTCKGRLQHLKQTIVPQLHMGAGEYLLVDYEDPDCCGDWAQAKFGDQVTVVRPAALRPPYFNISHARNVGGMAATGRVLVFMDADIAPASGFLEAICKGFNLRDDVVLMRLKHCRENWSKLGTCAVRAETFQAIRGYREAMDSWGAEDVDFYERCKAEGKELCFPGDLLSMIEHDNELRLAHYPESDKIASHKKMQQVAQTAEGMVNSQGFGNATPLQRGVITSADADYFPGLQLLFQSIQETEATPFRCVDLGLSQEQREWCQRNALQLIDVPRVDMKELQDNSKYADRVKKSQHLWIKPWLVSESPFVDTLWIDADCVVTRPLSELFPMIEEGVVCFPDANHPAATPNDPRLYELLPVPQVTDAHLNSGVVGLRKERDADLIYWWKFAVQQATNRKDIRELISWHDQGCLIWAMHKTGRADLIRAETKWNHPPHGWNHLRVKERRRYHRDTILRDIRGDHPQAGIVHYMARPKLWELVDG